MTKSEKLPTKICHDCLFQMEIHTEFRTCVLQNEQRLREFAGELFPKEEEEEEEEEQEEQQVNGIPEEFTEQELQSATVIDPNQVYVSSSDEEGEEEEDNEDDDDDDGEEEEGEITGIYQQHFEQLNHRMADDLEEEEQGQAILLSDDDDNDEDHSLSYRLMPGILGPNESSSHHQIGRQSSSAAAPASTSILEQQLMQGFAHHLTQQHHQHNPHLPEQKTFFLCQFCDLGFKFQENCTEHELTKHDASFPYNCTYCLFSSDQRVILQQHLRDEHGMQKPFLCTECKKGFTRRSDLRKHTIVHTGVRPYTCQVCQKSFSRNTNLTKHMRIHAGLKPFVCAKCPRTFVTGSDLVRHQRIHDGVKPFQCSVCPSTFARRDKLINHQNMHIRRGHLAGGEQHFQGISSNNNINNNNNNNNHHFLTANVPAPFSLPPSVPSVADNNNPGMVIDLDPLTEMRSANGMDMSQRILEAALMRGSLALTTPNHFGTLMNLPEQLFAADPTPSPAAATSDVMSLQQQMEQQSFPPPPAPFQSLAPPQQTSQLSSAGSFPQGNHRGGGGVEGQTVSRPFVCLEPLCGKRFPRKGELERHETVHSGAKPFGCPMCDKRFSRKDKLVRHRRTHLMAQQNNGGEGMGVNGQRTQAMEVQQRTELPQISFTTALENFRRTEFINSQAPSMGGGGGGGGVLSGASVRGGGGVGGGQRDVHGGLEAKDFLFRPNFYSQINFGEETGTMPTTTATTMEMTRAVSPGTVTGQEIKREF